MKRAALLAAASACVCFRLLAYAADDAPESRRVHAVQVRTGDRRGTVRDSTRPSRSRRHRRVHADVEVFLRGPRLHGAARDHAAIRPGSFAGTVRHSRRNRAPFDHRLRGRRWPAGVATIREGSASRREPQPPGVFTMAGYAPPSMQMALMRFWNARGRPASIPVLPRGTARIEPRGRDEVDGRRPDGRARPVQRERRDLGTRDAVDRCGRPAGGAGERGRRIRSLRSRPTGVAKRRPAARRASRVRRDGGHGRRPPLPRARRRAARSRSSARRSST